MADVPVDFEKKVREASSPNGTGYPYRISARDLMQNFVFAALQVQSSEENQTAGLYLTETTETGLGGHEQRKVGLAGTLDVSQASGVDTLVQNYLATVGANMNIKIYSISENSEGKSGPRTLSATIYIRNGSVLGITDPGGTPSGLIELELTNFFGFIS